jgi:hypothetical protein
VRQDDLRLCRAARPPSTPLLPVLQAVHPQPHSGAGDRGGRGGAHSGTPRLGSEKVRRSVLREVESALLVAGKPCEFVWRSAEELAAG